MIRDTILAILKAKHSFFLWCSLSPPFTDPPIHSRFKSILQHGPYNLGLDFKKHGSPQVHDQLVVGSTIKHWITQVLFGRHCVAFQNNNNNHHHSILTKLGSNSILKFFSKPENHPTPNNGLFTIQSVASGISGSLILLSLGALMHYKRPSAPKNYIERIRLICRDIESKNYPKLIVGFMLPVIRRIRRVYSYRILYLGGLGLVPTVMYGHLETIPYTKRKKILIIPPSTDKILGEILFDEEEQKKLKILPKNHPYSVQVLSVSKRILEALQSELKFKGRDDMELSSENNVDNKKERKWLGGRWQQDKLSTEHLDGLEWQVVVVSDPTINAYCLPGGKIVVYTGLLRHLKSDAQVATVIGHEVGHIVARHHADSITKNFWVLIGRMIICPFWLGSTPKHHIKEVLKNFIELPWSRRDEREADYIGLLLMASAGYDPRKAPEVYKIISDPFKTSSDSKCSDSDDIFSTHPSGRKRAKELSKSEVMEEAMARFSKAIPTRRRDVLTSSFWRSLL